MPRKFKGAIMKFFIALFFLLPVFNLCWAELTLPEREKPAVRRTQRKPQQQTKTSQNDEANKALHEAAEKMHLRGIYNALLAGADINAKIENIGYYKIGDKENPTYNFTYDEDALRPKSNKTFNSQRIQNKWEKFKCGFA